jgi:uncharacterized membrane protein
MLERVLFVLTLLSALGAGLMAGLFFAFSVFIMSALGRLAPASGTAAMQAINVAILNPVFFVVFFGTAAVSLLLGVAALIQWSEAGSAYLMAGSLLYLIGNITVTVAFNVPLNEALAAVTPTSAEASPVWTRYLSVWTAWNHVRTLACLASSACFIMALR